MDVRRSVLAFLLFYVSVVLAIGVIRGETTIAKYFELKESEAILQQTVLNLEQENEELALEIEKINESPSYARKVLRDKYHVVDENEKIVFYGE